MGSGPTAFDVDLGRKIKNVRLALGLTQSKVAQAIGVSMQQLQKYEKGGNRISASRLNQLGAALKVDFSRAVATADAQFVQFEFAPEEQRLISAFSKLDAGQKVLVQSLVDALGRPSGSP